MTNFEKIKNMSVDEMAECLMRYFWIIVAIHAK